MITNNLPIIWGFLDRLVTFNASVVSSFASSAPQVWLLLFRTWSATYGMYYMLLWNFVFVFWRPFYKCEPAATADINLSQTKDTSHSFGSILSAIGCTGDPRRCTDSPGPNWPCLRGLCNGQYRPNTQAACFTPTTLCCQQVAHVWQRDRATSRRFFKGRSHWGL